MTRAPGGKGSIATRGSTVRASPRRIAHSVKSARAPAGAGTFLRIPTHGSLRSHVLRDTSEGGCRIGWTVPQPDTGTDVTGPVQDDTGHVAESAPREPETVSAFVPTSLRNRRDTGPARHRLKRVAAAGFRPVQYNYRHQNHWHGVRHGHPGQAVSRRRAWRRQADILSPRQAGPRQPGHWRIHPRERAGMALRAIRRHQEPLHLLPKRWAALRALGTDRMLGRRHHRHRAFRWP